MLAAPEPKRKRGEMMDESLANRLASDMPDVPDLQCAICMQLCMTAVVADNGNEQVHPCGHFFCEVNATLGEHASRSPPRGVLSCVC